MRATKENREYTITEADVASFVAEGYDIYDEMGRIVQYGAGKTVTYDKYAQLEQQFEALMEENASLSEEVGKLKAKLKKKEAKDV